MTDYERIEAVLDHSGLRNNALAKSLGYTNGTILYQIKNGRNGISASLARRISDVYPDISQNWLLTGKGDMLINSHPLEQAWDPQKINQMEVRVKGLEARIELLENKVEKLISGIPPEKTQG
ncbi:MAG: helix-turn-helix transcriptional regulator [Flavobacteriales bacterium]|jgi:hypothetical protein|nr:helix-turn-helix transcriptional regulator [Flavobacteriales bacterium]